MLLLKIQVINMALQQQPLIRVITPRGVEHIIPASNKNFYLSRNASLLRGSGSDVRADLLFTIQEFTPEENAAYYANIAAEADRQSTRAKKLRQAAMAANIASGNSSNGNGNANNDLISKLIEQNTVLMQELSKVGAAPKSRRNGKATV